MNRLLDRPLAKAIASITLGALLAGAALYFIFPTHKVSKLSAKDLILKAQYQDGAGVTEDTPFTLTSSTQLDLEQVKALMQVKPATTLSYTQKSDKEIEITASEKLTKNRVYQFSIPTVEQQVSWAFQVKGEFRVVTTLPSDKATGVPVNTGIEFTFTHETYKDYEKYFSISPNVPGKFEKHSRTLVFIPSKLEPKTVYTVSLKKGLPLDNSELKLEEDTTMQFETASNEKTPSYFEMSRDQIEWSPAAQQDIIFNMDNSLRESLNRSNGPTTPENLEKLDVAVYKMNNRDLYISSYEKLLKTTYWATFNRYQIQDVLKGSSKVKEFSAPIQYQGYQNFVTLPERLDKGYYLLEMKYTGTGAPRYLWVQVTDLAGYISLKDAGALVWTHNLADKSPIKGAKVTFSDGSSMTTDANGMAKMNLPSIFIDDGKQTPAQEKNRPTPHAEIVAPNGDRLISFLNTYTSSQDASDNYRSYLYTDRPTYKQDDTVNYWGVIRPKSGATPSKVTVQISTYNYGNDYFGFDPSDDRAVIIDEQEVAVSDMGSYTSKFPLKNIGVGYYEIRTKIGMDTISSTSIEVATYTKPAYAIDISTPTIINDRAMAGDKVTATISAHFFEGTPLAFKKIHVTAGQDYSTPTQESDVTTDKNGKATFTYNIPAYNDKDTNEYWPKSLLIEATPLSQEEGEIVGRKVFTAYGADALIQTSSTSSNNTQNVTINLNKLDRSKDDTIGAPLSNYPIRAKIIETTYTRRVTGQSYDFLNKTTIDHVEYTANLSTTKSLDLTTDAKGFVSTSEPVEPAKTKMMELEITAPNGKITRSNVYISNFYSGEYLSLESAKSDSYMYNEKSTLTITKGNLAAPEDNYLFVITSDNGVSYVTQRSPTLNVTYLESYGPVAMIQAVQFTGNTYSFIGTNSMHLNLQKEKQLKIEITTDKASYEPGDTVTIRARTTKNGKGVAADTNLSLVDEAYFSIFNHGAYILQNLNTSSIYGRYGGAGGYNYASHNPESANGLGGAEGGGGGGDERKSFPDNALFTTITTDGSGNGETTFKLPDNLTSWKVTAQAVDRDINSGVETHDIPVKLPFFVDAVLADSYLVQDKPIIQIRTFGTNIPAGSTVTMTISEPTLGAANQTVTAKIFDTIDVALPPLQVGTHTITISAECNGQKDMLTRTFNVVSSRLTTFGTKTVVATGMKSVPAEILAAKSNVTITLQNTEKARLYAELWNEAYQAGARFDQVVAGQKALTLLSSIFKIQDLPGDIAHDTSISEIYQDGNGGIKLLPYASADLELSARAAILAPEFVNQPALKDYFANILKEEAARKYPKATRERYIMAISGLAALHEPVLVALQNLSNETDLTPIEKIYLSAGAMAIGDQGTAKRLTEELIKNNGETITPYLRIKVGKTNDEILRHTALVAVVAADLNLGEREALNQYAFEQSATEIDISLERNAYIEHRAPFISGADESVSYTLNGKSETKKLENGDSVQLTVPVALLSSFSINSTKGDVSATFVYEHGTDAASLRKDPNISIARSYMVGGKAVTSWKATDSVVIQLTPKFGAQSLDGCYSINDYLPSGLKPLTWNVSTSRQDGGITRPFAIVGQQAQFCVGKGMKGSLRFPVRVVGKGVYVAEPATMQISDRPGSSTASDAGIVTIQQ